MNDKWDEGTKKGSSQNHFHVEAATIAAEDAGAAYQTPSLIAAGADAQQVSLLSAILNLPIALLYLKLPTIMKKIGSRKRAVVIIAFLDVLTWFPLIAAMYFVRPLSSSLLVILWVINLLPNILPIPIRDSWLADTVPMKTISRHLGLRAAISAAVYLITFYVMGYILDSFAGKVYIGFVFITATALGATIIKAFVYSRIKDNRNVVKLTEFRISAFLQETKGEGLGRLILYVSLFHFAVAICSPLFAVYMITYLHFSYIAFALVFSSEFIGRVISAPFWGKYSDNIQKLAFIKTISSLIPLVPLFWLISSNVAYLIILQLVSGVLWAGFDICGRSLIYLTAPQSKRAGYIIYERSLVTLCKALGALAGAGILVLLISVFGQGIMWIFVLSGIMRFAVARIMLPAIRIPSTSTERSIADQIRTGIPRDPIPRKNTLVTATRGIYYLRSPILSSQAGAGNVVEDQRYSLSSKPVGNIIIDVNDRQLSNRMSIIGTRKLFYREPLFYRSNSDDAMVSLSIPEGTRETSNEKQFVTKTGLFYQSEEWEDFKVNALKKIRFGRGIDLTSSGRRIKNLVSTLA